MSNPFTKTGDLEVTSYQNPWESAAEIPGAAEDSNTTFAGTYWPQDDSVSELTMDACSPTGYRWYLNFSFHSNLTRIVSVKWEKGLLHVDVPDTVRELCDKCFYDCRNLMSVRFGARSQLERIGVEAFPYSWDLRKVRIPDSVREVGDRFMGDTAVRQVIFGAFSRIERMGIEAFWYSGIEEISIPSGVPEIGDRCFYRCYRLESVTFCSNSKLERIGDWVFFRTRVKELYIPDTVRELGEGCCYHVESLEHVILGMSSKLERIGGLCFAKTSIHSFAMPRTLARIGSGAFSCITLTMADNWDINGSFVTCSGLLLNKDLSFCLAYFGSVCEIVIPDTVKEIGDYCCYCRSDLERVTFGARSQVQRIGSEAFFATKIQEINIPDSMHELCDKCFMYCRDLTSVTFGERSELERIGSEAFCHTQLGKINIPDSVRQLSDRCFLNSSLASVGFTAASRLESLGMEVFARTHLEELDIPKSVREMHYRSFTRCTSLRRVTFVGSSLKPNPFFYQTCAGGFRIPDHIRIIGGRGNHRHRDLSVTRLRARVNACCLGVSPLWWGFVVVMLLAIALFVLRICTSRTKNMHFY